MINNFEINQIDSHDIILYRMDKNNHLYLDDIIYVNRNNPIIKRVLDFIIYRLNTFQNTDIYFNSVVKYLNSILDSTVQIFFNNICLTHDLSGKKIDYKTYLSSFNNNISETEKYCFFPIDLKDAYKSIDYRFITNLSKQELLNSPMFLSTIINYSFDKKKKFNTYWNN